MGVYTLTCPKGHSLDKPGMVILCNDVKDGPFYCPTCGGKLIKLELRVESLGPPSGHSVGVVVAAAGNLVRNSFRDGYLECASAIYFDRLRKALEELSER